jgi:hypothetical protein
MEEEARCQVSNDFVLYSSTGAVPDIVVWRLSTIWRATDLVSIVETGKSLVLRLWVYCVYHFTWNETVG